MGKRTEFLYLNEEDMIGAGVLDTAHCIDVEEEIFKLLSKGDYVMGGDSHNSHGIALSFPKESEFPNMPLDGPDRRFMAMRRQVVWLEHRQSRERPAPLRADRGLKRSGHRRTARADVCQPLKLGADRLRARRGDPSSGEKRSRSLRLCRRRPGGQSLLRCDPAGSAGLKGARDL